MQSQKQHAESIMLLLSNSFDCGATTSGVNNKAKEATMEVGEAKVPGGGGGGTRGALPEVARTLVLLASACSDGDGGIRAAVTISACRRGPCINSRSAVADNPGSTALVRSQLY